MKKLLATLLIALCASATAFAALPPDHDGAPHHERVERGHRPPEHRAEKRHHRQHMERRDHRGDHEHGHR